MGEAHQGSIQEVITDADFGECNRQLLTRLFRRTHKLVLDPSQGPDLAEQFPAVLPTGPKPPQTKSSCLSHAPNRTTQNPAPAADLPHRRDVRGSTPGSSTLKTILLR